LENNQNTKVDYSKLNDKDTRQKLRIIASTKMMTIPDDLKAQALWERIKKALLEAAKETLLVSQQSPGFKQRVSSEILRDLSFQKNGFN
jgi:hypothetical protein